MPDLTFASCVMGATPTWTECGWALLDSNFFSALLGAGFGAWAGARAAQRSAARAKLEEDLQAEIRNTNAALSLTFSVCNTLAGLMRQHVRALKATHDTQRAAVHEALRQGVPPRLGNVDLESLETVELPVHRVEQLVFEKLSAGTRPLVLTSTLARTIESLNRMIGERNNLLEELRASGPQFDGAKARIVFAIRDPNGNTDNRYTSWIDGIHQRTKDGIYFSKALGDDLVAHGEIYRTAYQKKLGRVAPRMNAMVFPADAQNLVPPAEEYADFMSMFVVRLPERSLPWSTWLRRQLFDRPCIRCRRLVQRLT